MKAKLKSKAPVIYVEYTDDGCSRYRCGKCRSEIETRTGAGKFCQNCGVRFAREIVLEDAIKNRWKRAVIAKKKHFSECIFILGATDRLAERRPGWVVLSEPVWICWLEMYTETGWLRVHKSTVEAVLEPRALLNDMHWDGAINSIAAARAIMRKWCDVSAHPDSTHHELRLAVAVSSVYRPAYRPFENCHTYPPSGFSLRLFATSPDAPLTLELKAEDDRPAQTATTNAGAASATAE